MRGVLAAPYPRSMAFSLDDLTCPLVAAPMAGGVSTPSLVAAVARAGAIGFLAGGYLSASQVRDDIAAVRSLGASAFGVNLFWPPGRPADLSAAQAYRTLLAPEAERRGVIPFHDPERFGDRDNALMDYDPAFHVTDPSAVDTETDTSADAGDSGSGGSDQACMSAASASEDAIGLLCLLGWAPETARASVEHVCGALMRAGTRQSAYEALRRDRHARALLDLPRASWTVLLRALLGNPHPAYAATSAGKGVLLRLLIGETLPVLLRDDDLVLSLSLAAPRRRPAGGEAQ